MANIIVNKETENATVTVDNTECCLVLGAEAYDVFIPDKLLKNNPLPIQVEIMGLVQWIIDEHPELLAQLKRKFIISQLSKMALEDKFELVKEILQ